MEVDIRETEIRLRKRQRTQVKQEATIAELKAKRAKMVIANQEDEDDAYLLDKRISKLEKAIDKRKDVIAKKEDILADQEDFERRLAIAGEEGKAIGKAAKESDD